MIPAEMEAHFEQSYIPQVTIAKNECVTAGCEEIPVTINSLIRPKYVAPEVYSLSDTSKSYRAVAYQLASEITSSGRISTKAINKITSILNSSEHIHTILKCFTGSEERMRAGNKIFTIRIALVEFNNIKIDGEKLSKSLQKLLILILFDVFTKLRCTASLTQYTEVLSTNVDTTDFDAKFILRNIVTDKIFEVIKTGEYADLPGVTDAEGYFKVKVLASVLKDTLRPLYMMFVELTSLGHAYTSTMSRVFKYHFDRRGISDQQKARFVTDSVFLELAHDATIIQTAQANGAKAALYNEDQWNMYDRILLQCIKNSKNLEMIQIKEMRKFFTIQTVKNPDGHKKGMIISRPMKVDEIKSIGLYEIVSAGGKTSDDMSVYMYDRCHEVNQLEEFANEISVYCSKLGENDIMTNFIKSFGQRMSDSLLIAQGVMQSVDILGFALSLSFKVSLLYDRKKQSSKFMLYGEVDPSVNLTDVTNGTVVDGVVKSTDMRGFVYLVAKDQQGEPINFSQYEYKVLFKDVEYIDKQEGMGGLKTSEKFDLAIKDPRTDIVHKMSASWEDVIGESVATSVVMTNVRMLHAKIGKVVKLNPLMKAISNELQKTTTMPGASKNGIDVTVFDMHRGFVTAETLRDLSKIRIVEVLGNRLFEMWWNNLPDDERVKYSSMSAVMADSYILMMYRLMAVKLIIKVLDCSPDIIDAFSASVETGLKYVLNTTQAGGLA